MDNNEMVSPASEEFEALLPEGWTGEGDFFDESTWGAETGTGADESQDGGADMAENDAGIDDNGGSPTTEDGAVDGGETDTAGADGASDGEQSQASPSKLKFSAKLDHQFKDVELDEAELPTIYQKAYATDRAQEKLAKLQPMQEKGDRLAALKLLGSGRRDAVGDEECRACGQTAGGNFDYLAAIDLADNALENHVLRHVAVLHKRAVLLEQVGELISAVGHAPLQRLADNLGTEVLISDPDKDFSFEGTKYNLSAEQYEELATVRGQVAYGMLSDLMNDIGYSQLSDEAKAKAIDNLVSYAAYSARKSVMPEYDTDQNTWIEKCDGDESRVMYMAMMKALASEADITASNNSDFYSLILNTPWLGTTDQSYMLAQTWYLSGSYLTDSQHRGYQFLLDKEQREEVNYIYRTIFPNYFVEMVSTDEWWYAETIDEKLAMLKEVRDSSAAEARAIAQQRLRDAGVQSVPKQ